MTAADNTVWYPDTKAIPVSIWVRSRRGNGTGVCESAGRDMVVYPALSMTLPAYTPPFRLESEPCFTPPDPDPEQVINGCVKDKNGALRIVADPADCTSRETPISWNQRGR